jgi:hypothetical protein
VKKFRNQTQHTDYVVVTDLLLNKYYIEWMILIKSAAISVEKVKITSINPTEEGVLDLKNLNETVGG